MVMLVAWLPMVLKELPLSLPIFCVGIGFLLFTALDNGDEPHPLRYPVITERLSELIVIVSLTGCGLKLDRPFSRQSWRVTWRLLGIAMPISIVLLAILGFSLAGLSIAGAVLVAAALSPTDPVLASEIQVGPPDTGEEDEVRFSLTSEAGLNDGLAFPFVNLALALAMHGATKGWPAEWSWAGEWLVVDVIWKVGVGCAMGWLIGRLLGHLTFRIPNRAKLSRTGDGFLALALTFVSYGLTEMVHGYGFLAVFISALTFRSTEPSEGYNRKLHDFAEEAERLLMMLLLVLFGGALATGLLESLTWRGALAGLVFLFLVRPLATWIAMRGIPRPPGEILAIGFFGIRGLGSIYYVAYAMNREEWPEADAIWAIVGFVVVVSIMLHGTTVTPAMRLLDKKARHREWLRSETSQNEG